MSKNDGYRFGAAAVAIGVSERTLRNWMARYESDLFSERPKGGWRTFSRNDVLLLSVVAELIRFGAGYPTAIEAVRAGLADVNFKTFEGLGSHLYAAPWSRGEEQEGRWIAGFDRDYIESVTASRGSVQLFVTRIMADARNRLDAINGELR